jgi:predicted transcriptional regulator
MSTSAVIREIRQEQKMQINQLAKLSGLHRNTIYRVEKGDDISVLNFEKMLKVFGYELEIMKCKD